MPAKRYSVEQIVAKLREAEKHQGQGLTIPQSCKRLGISEQTFYRWRIKYGALKEDEAQRLKALEQENGRLKKIVAEHVTASPGACRLGSQGDRVCRRRSTSGRRSLCSAPRSGCGCKPSVGQEGAARSVTGRRDAATPSCARLVRHVVVTWDRKLHKTQGAAATFGDPYWAESETGCFGGHT